MDNKYNSNKFDVTAAKKSRKNIINAGSNKESNGSKAEIFQSICQTNTDVSRSTLFAIQKCKYCAIKTFIRVIKKKRLLNATKICNSSKSFLPNYTKMTRGHKIVIFIDNVVKKLANICELRTKSTECAIKFLVSIYSYNKHFLLGGLKLLRDEKNMPIFLSLIGKI